MSEPTPGERLRAEHEADKARIAALPVFKVHAPQLFWIIVFANLTSGVIGGVIAGFIVSNS